MQTLYNAKISKMIDVSNLNCDVPNAVFIRHTQRYEIEDGQQGDHVNITPNGKKMAVEFGKKLKKYNLNAIYTSPVKRCIHTSEKILEGYEKEIDIFPSKMLGDPSAYIKNIEIAQKTLKKMNFSEEYLSYLKNENPRPGFYSLKEGSERLQSFLNEKTNKNGITLFISHDLVILYYIYYRNRKIYTKDNWLDFLDGIILTVNNGNLQ